MSGRRRRSESLWDRKEDVGPQTEISGKIPCQGKEFHSSFGGDGSPKQSHSEANDAFISGDISGQPSRESKQGNENIAMDNENNVDRRSMKTDPAFDEWEDQYTSRPSDNCYDLPYRSGDRGVGGTGNTSKDRDRSRSRSWSPHRSRGRDRDRDRGSTRGLARSRSRSRSRSRGRDRSPFGDARRGSYESGDLRNDSRVPSRLCKDFVAGNCRRGSQCRFLHQELVDSRGGGNRSDNDMTEKWSRPEYSGGSRYRDDRNSADRPRSKGSDGYHRGNRNAYDDQDHRRQSNQSTRALCRFFIMGQCNRNNCKYSHDAPKPGGYEGRSHDNIPSHDSGNNSRPWNERQPQDHVSASGFSDFPKSNRHFDDKNKSWNDLESRDFDEMSRDNIQGDDKNRIWGPPGWNESEKNLGIPCFQQQQKPGEGSVSMVIDNSNAHNMVSGDTNQQIHSHGSDFIQSVHNMSSQFPPTLNGTDQSSLNGPTLQSNGSVQGMFLHLDLQKQAEIQNKQAGKPLETSRNDSSHLMRPLDATVASTEQVPQVPVSLPQISQKLNLANALEFLYSLPNNASSGPLVDSMVVQQNLDTKSKEQYVSARDTVVSEPIKTSVPMGILSNTIEQENQMSVEQVSSVATVDPNPSKLGADSILESKQEPAGNLEINENKMAENLKREHEATKKSEAQGKVEEGNISNDEKAMRLFKVALVEFVKEILKPTWKEGKMSREVYKTIVKKVVDKVTSTIQGNQIPRTPEKIDQYLAFSKSKITKLVEAYVGRFLKA